jgi:hypothetical protein
VWINTQSNTTKHHIHLSTRLLDIFAVSNSALVAGHYNLLIVRGQYWEILPRQQLIQLSDSSKQMLAI